MKLELPEQNPMSDSPNPTSPAKPSPRPYDWIDVSASDCMDKLFAGAESIDAIRLRTVAANGEELDAAGPFFDGSPVFLSSKTDRETIMGALKSYQQYIQQAPEARQARQSLDSGGRIQVARTTLEIERANSPYEWINTSTPGWTDGVVPDGGIAQAIRLRVVAANGDVVDTTDPVFDDPDVPDGWRADASGIEQMVDEYRNYLYFNADPEVAAARQALKDGGTIQVIRTTPEIEVGIDPNAGKIAEVYCLVPAPPSPRKSTPRGPG